VLAARQSGLLVNGGGHAMAAGLTVESGSLAGLRGFLARYLKRQIEDSGYRPSLGVDGVIQPTAASAELVRALERLAPFGVGNAEPRFALSAARIVQAQVVGEDHVRCTLTGRGGGRLKAIAFRALDGALGQPLLRSGGRPLHLAGKLRPDGWAGPEGVQLIIDDAAQASG